MTTPYMNKRFELISIAPYLAMIRLYPETNEKLVSFEGKWRLWVTNNLFTHMFEETLPIWGKILGPHLGNAWEIAPILEPLKVRVDNESNKENLIRLEIDLDNHCHKYLSQVMFQAGRIEAFMDRALVVMAVAGHLRDEDQVIWCSTIGDADRISEKIASYRRKLITTASR